MTEQNVATRLKFFIDEKGLTSTRFADLCKIPRPSISQLLNGRNKKISDILVGQIHSAFPELSVVWLLFGEGPMIVAGADHSPKNFFEDAENGIFDDEFDRVAENRQENSILGALNSGYSFATQPISVQNENLRQRPEKIEQPRPGKKISHITVYYDDSTFETFFPH